MIATLEPRPSFGRLPWIARVNGIALAAILAGLSRLLLPSWKSDPDLTHGLFVPVLFLVLLFESRRHPAPRYFGSGESGDWAAGGLGLAALAALGIAGVYAAVLGWSHALVEFLLAASAACLLAAAWLAFADRRLRWLSFSWPAGVAILLWLLAAPLPPGTYSALALTLQGRVTAGVVATLRTCGIPAYQAGNVIELARTEIGVSEACSGVRSLVSCAVAGLFFSAAFTLRPRSKAIILLVAPASALALNFVRSLVLAFVASRGIPIAGAWHDATGLAIITVTGGLLALVAWRLNERTIRAVLPAPKRAVRLAPTRRQNLLAGTLAIYGTLAAALLWCGAAGSPAGVPQPPVDLGPLMPAPPPGWRVQAEGDLAAFRSTLRTDTLAARTYWRQDTDGLIAIKVYLAYWRPGQVPVSLVAAHTPDTCWPGTGWEARPFPRVQDSLEVGGERIPETQSRLFARDGFSEYVWFWHLSGGRALSYEHPYSLVRLFHLAARYGFEPSQAQLFVRLSSNRPWEKISSQPVVQRLFTALRPMGL